MANRLIRETSPYLQQHAHNPVDWWPYCEEAFSEAEKLDKPVFISIGYSSCHWCMVMERESFEDKNTAEYMNEHFINIKVDREEHPGVDRVYQRYYNSMTGESGGWPLSVWSFPDGLPFMIGTYFPKNFNLSMKTFMSINKEIVESWKNEREELFEVAVSLARNLDSSNKIMFKEKNTFSDQILYNELKAVQQRFDRIHGGIDGEPKFPRFALMRFLLQEGYIRGATPLIDHIRFTFHKMANGGIYDQLGGGISRYSVDRKWLVPHFEKMLYDQAGMLRVAADLYALTQDPLAEYIIEDIISFLVREMKDDHGAFYSSIHAESEGVEGKFYSWSLHEIKEAMDSNYWDFPVNLGFIKFRIDKPSFMLNDDYKIAKTRYGLSRTGNFKDPHGNIKNGNILHIGSSISKIADEYGISRSEVVTKLNYIKNRLFEVREKRIKPAVDKKIITAWNAMLITSLFNVAEKLNRPSIADLAIPALEYIIDKNYVDGDLLRSYYNVEGEQELRKIDGILDDYAFLIEALISAFEYTDRFDYIQVADTLLGTADSKFFDTNTSMYYINDKKDEDSIGRLLSAMDDSFSSSLAIMVSNLMKLGKYLERDDLIERGQEIILRLAKPMEEYDAALNELMISASMYLRSPTEIVIVKDIEKKFDPPLFQTYVPGRLVFRYTLQTDNKPSWEVLTNRIDVDTPTVYICKGMTCSLPITEVRRLKNELTKI